MTDCPCCSHPMLRHVRHRHVYWFCRGCWQEMPSLDTHRLGLLSTTVEQHLDRLRLERSLAAV